MKIKFKKYRDEFKILDVDKKDLSEEGELIGYLMFGPVRWFVKFRCEDSIFHYTDMTDITRAMWYLNNQRQMPEDLLIK